MPRYKRTALIAASALFAAIGLVVLIVDSEERLTGAFIVLFFGSSLLVFVAPSFGRSEPQTRHAVLSHRGERSEALVFPLVRSRMRIFGIAAAIWAICGVLMIVYPEALADPGESTAFLRLLGVALLVMFGGVAVLAALQEKRGGFVALLPQGILARAGIGKTFVPWEAIESVEVVSMYDTPMVAVRATDPSAVEISTWARLLSLGNRSMMGADLFFANLAVPEHELANAIAERLEHPERRTEPL